MNGSINAVYQYYGPLILLAFDVKDLRTFLPKPAGADGRGAIWARVTCRFAFLLLASAMAIASGLAQDPPPESPAPAPPLLSVRNFLVDAAHLGETNQVRVQGTVTHSISDRTYFIQDDGAGVYVFHKPDVPFHPGERLEVTGYPSLGGALPTLQKCTARLIGLGSVPPARDITGTEILSPAHAMTRVRVRGILVDGDLMSGRLIVLHPTDGGPSFQVNLEAIDNPSILSRPEPGSLLEAVGVLVQRSGRDSRPSSGSILVSNSSDLRILSGPPFWTLRRVGEALIGLMVVLVLALVWVWMLRKQVRSQTRLVEERFEREATLRALEDRFAKVFRAVPDGMVITRAADDLILEVNPAFEALAGADAAKLVNQKESALGLWQNPANQQKALTELADRSSLANFECALRSSAGQAITCLYAAEWIELKGERCRLGIFRNITEQKRFEEERRALQTQLERTQRIESLGTLAGGIAHDFNNILAAILGNAELARQGGQLPEDALQSLEEIRKASLRGRSLVDRILSFNRSQAQTRTPISLGPIIAEAGGLLRATLPAAITLETNLDPSTPPVLADATQIHQIVMNLGANASHAIGHQPGRIKISLCPATVDATICARLPELKPGLYACLVVSDTGTGMPPSVQERIFEPFFTTKSPGKGTGLGLSAVHSFIKSHNGAIEVQSAPGQGTAFSIFLPATKASSEPAPEPSPAPAPAPPPLEPASPSAAPKEILVIDDEQLIVSVVVRILNRLGHKAASFLNPVEAVELFEREPTRFSLVLTDLNMPGMTGLEVAKRIHAARPDTRVILASGNISGELIERALNTGATRIIHKPITMIELTDAIREELAHASA